MKSVENVLRHLAPEPKFYGSLAANNQAAYDAIEWVDDRTKPTWAALLAAAPDFESAAVEVEIITTIKSLTGQVITALAPEWQQRNMLATALRIENKQRLGTSTAEEDAAAVAIITAWGSIEAVRTLSDQLEAAYVLAADNLSADDLATITAELVAAANPA